MEASSRHWSGDRKKDNRVYCVDDVAHNCRKIISTYLVKIEVNIGTVTAPACEGILSG